MNDLLNQKKITDEPLKEIRVEYRHADRKKRTEMWLMFTELRGTFDEIERSAKPPDSKFGVDACTTCCR